MTRPLTIVSLILSIAGIAVAGYLTYVHYNLGALVCGIGDCETVQASKYSEVFGIPIAILGLVAYIALAGLIVARATMPDYADFASLAILFILITGTLYYIYLTYLELKVIYAVCQWCVISFIITVLLLTVELVRFRRSMNEVDTGFDATEG
ncbi:MAG TPA: vitamin K epoxide reductase family protein [Thermomicrobiales bacterium]|nr:vitamin K epoxide reductase family protein [Thermomicrobiales bacterium]